MQPLEPGDLCIPPDGHPHMIIHVDQMLRLECKDQTHSKFYEMRLKGPKLIKRYGRIGYEGKEKVDTYKDEVKAEKAFNSMKASKVKKGYKVIGNIPIYAFSAPGLGKESKGEFTHTRLEVMVRVTKWEIKRRAKK